MKKENFVVKMAFLQGLYGSIDDSLHSVYWSILKQYSDETFGKMIEKIVASFKPTSTVKFPLPPHFLEAVGLSGDGRVQLAVNAVKKAQGAGPYRSISFGDKSLHATILRFGGWPIVCGWSLRDWEFNEKKFSACYESELSCGSGPDYLTGLNEEHNSEKFHLFSEVQKKSAIRNSGIAEFGWVGYDETIELPSPKDQLLISSKPEKRGGMQTISEIGFKF